MNLFIIGLPGSGKTTAARELARLLDRVFIDTDQEIEKREKATISEIFEKEGEAYFRKLEEDILDECLIEAGAIVATGGGLPAHSHNMEKMLEQGLVLWLDTPLQVCAGRLIHQDLSKRPMLSGYKPDEIEGRLKDLLVSRTPYYQKADIRVVEPYILSKISALLSQTDAIHPLF